VTEYDGESLYYQKVGQSIQDLESRKEVLDKIGSSLPASSSLAPLMYFFQKKAAETGMMVNSITFSNSTPTGTVAQIQAQEAKKEVKDITFAIDLVGNYQGLKNFLFALEQSARILEVDTLSLTSIQSLQGAKGKLQTYDFKMQIKTHTY